MRLVLEASCVIVGSMVEASSPRALPLSWSREGEQHTSAPVFGDDVVYWGDGSGRLLCLDSTNGKQHWATVLGDGALARVALCGSSVLAQSQTARGARLAWLRRDDGAVVHQVELPDVRSLACGDGAIALLIPEAVGPRDVPWQLLKLDPDGRETARFSVGRAAYAINLAAGRVIVDFAKAVAAYDDAGSHVWRFAGPSFDVAEGGVLARSKDDGLVCLDSLTGAVRWTAAALLRGVDLVRRGPPLRSRPIVGDSSVIVLDRTRGAVHALDLETGAKRWSTEIELGESASGRARVHARGVLVVGGDGRLRLLSRETGKVERLAGVRSIWGLDAFDATDRHLAVIHHANLGMHLQVFDLSADAPRVPVARPAPATATPGKPSLAARMSAWAQLFAKRSDVRVLERSTRQGPGGGLTFPSRTPPDVRAFAEETLALSLRWVFADAPTPVMASAPGGRVRLELDPVLDFELRTIRGEPTFASVHGRACAIDRASDEALGLLFAEPRKKHATMAFGQASDDAVIRFESFEAYLTRGARSAFGDYWQAQSLDSRGTVARLRATSMDPNTPRATLVASLVARGASSEMAEALVDWLQADVVLLLQT